MLTYFSEWDSGELLPFWPHLWLLSLSVLASFAVGIGILFERPKYSESVHKIAFWLVMGGIAIEACCTIFLFVFDEGISSAQQDKIISLETQIAPRRITSEQCADISKSVKSFSESTVRIDTYSLDIEGGILGWQIAGCLAQSLTVDSEFASILPIGGFGVGVFVSGKDASLVAAIKDALEKASLRVMDGTGIFGDSRLTYRADASPNPAATVVVGVKPPMDMK